MNEIVGNDFEIILKRMQQMKTKDLKKAIQAGVKTAGELAKKHKEVTLYVPDTNKEIKIPKR